jgi:hypothetical protein
MERVSACEVRQHVDGPVARNLARSGNEGRLSRVPGGQAKPQMDGGPSVNVAELELGVSRGRGAPALRPTLDF